MSACPPTPASSTALTSRPIVPKVRTSTQPTPCKLPSYTHSCSCSCSPFPCTGDTSLLAMATCTLSIELPTLLRSYTHSLTLSPSHPLTPSPCALTFLPLPHPSIVIRHRKPNLQEKKRFNLSHFSVVNTLQIHRFTFDLLVRIHLLSFITNSDHPQKLHFLQHHLSDRTSPHQLRPSYSTRSHLFVPGSGINCA